MRHVLFSMALAALATAAPAQEHVEQRRTVAPDGVVSIDNQAGSIKVVGWSKSELEVKGTLGRGADGLEVGGSSRRITISVDTSGSHPHAVRSDLEIYVPAGSKLELESFSAPITVSDVTGAVHAESVMGSISITGAREVDVSAVQGNLDVTGATARVRAEAVNGNVTLRDVGGVLDASTVNGVLAVLGGSFERAQLETVSGSVRFEGELRASAHLDVNTVSGSVDLLLPAELGADCSINTFSGSIRSDFGPEPPRRKRRYSSAKEWHFTTGAGGANISIETLSGTINLRKRASK